MRRPAPLILRLAIVFGFGHWFLLTTGLDAAELATAVRRPSAAALISPSRLAIVNQNSGSVILIDTDQRVVLSETVIGNSLVAIKRINQGGLLVLDHESHQALLCRVQGDHVRTLKRIPVPPYPIDAAPSEDGRWCAVTSLWPRRISILAIGEGEDVSRTQDEPKLELELPFLPRCVMLIEDQHRMVVSDAFGGKLAVIRLDFSDGSTTPTHLAIESIREIPGHNIRHLSMTRDGQHKALVLTQMNLNQLAQPREDEIHWGTYLSSSLRSLKITNLINPESSALANSRTMTIGDVRNGSADPGAFVIDDNGHFLIPATGTNEVVMLDRYGIVIGRVGVGGGPTQIVSVGDSHYVTINRFGQSISFVELTGAPDTIKVTVSETIPLGPTPELSASQKGEQLFHSAELSHDGWMSCHSCHTEGHTSGRLADTMSDGGVGAAKRIPSLLGVSGTEPLGWNGASDFASQVRNSVRHTMHGEDLDPDQIDSLIAYLKSLPPPPRLAELHSSLADLPSPRRGKTLFRSLGCVKCHAGEEKTSASVFDVGLTDALGNRRFNPPSLRGVVYRERFLHDGRVVGLSDLLRRHHHPTVDEMNQQDVDDLIAFLIRL